MQPLLMQLRELLADAAFPWGLCGGYALELFAGKAIRPHGDVDLSLPESARTVAIAWMLARGWQMYEYRGMGKVKPLRCPQDSEPGRNLMAVRGEDAPVRFFPCEEEGLLYHQFMPGMTALNFLDLLFSKELRRPFIERDGLPVLSPEEALLYKAARHDEESACLDFAAVYPLLDDSQRAWLRSALMAQYPNGHPWQIEQE